jgi:hypothetical protein
MARVRSTTRVSREGDETEVTETTPISEVMRRSGLVVPEEATAETEQTVAEDGSDSESEEDNNILSPTKSSHIEFGRSTITAGDLVVMKKLGYFGENDDELICFAKEEVVHVVFKSFFWAGLRFPLYDMTWEVLKRFEIYLYQLTPNAIVRLSIYIWAL